MDQHFDGIGGKILSERINRIFDGRFGHDSPRPPHQELKPVDLAAAELDRNAGDAHFPLAGIEHHVAGSELDAKRLAGPSQQSANAGDKLVELEGLAQIVVGALIEAGHEVLQAVARREHEHWPRHLPAALVSEPDEAVHVGQTEIEQDACRSGWLTSALSASTVVVT